MKPGKSAVRAVSRAGHVIDVVAAVLGGKRQSDGSSLIRYNIPAGIMQLVKRAIEVVFVAQILWDGGVIRANERARLRTRPPQNITCLGVAQARDGVLFGTTTPRRLLTLPAIRTGGHCL